MQLQPGVPSPLIAPACRPQAALALGGRRARLLPFASARGAPRRGRSVEARVSEVKKGKKRGGGGGLLGKLVPGLGEDSEDESAAETAEAAPAEAKPADGGGAAATATPPAAPAAPAASAAAASTPAAPAAAAPARAGAAGSLAGSLGGSLAGSLDEAATQHTSAKLAVAARIRCAVLRCVLCCAMCCVAPHAICAAPSAEARLPAVCLSFIYVCGCWQAHQQHQVLMPPAWVRCAGIHLVYSRLHRPCSFCAAPPAPWRASWQRRSRRPLRQRARCHSRWVWKGGWVGPVYCFPVAQGQQGYRLHSSREGRGRWINCARSRSKGGGGSSGM